MPIDRTTNIRPSSGGGADGNKSTLELNSFVRVDMKALSQSELYSLSRSSSYAFDLCKPENDVIPNIDSDHLSTGPITTTPMRIFAFSHRRGPLRRTSASDRDIQVTENMLILNSLKKLVTDGDMAVPVVVKRKRKARKAKNEKEFEGLGMINVNGQVIDLKFLASSGDGAFESELNSMTEGMDGEDEFLGFLKGLEGRWGSSRKRRKYVDATVFVKALPINWKILLSLRPRACRPSLYCRRFVSPSNVHFNSCKDVAFYLKAQSETKNANPPEEGAMMQTETKCQMDLEPRCQAPRSSLHASKIDIMGINNLHIAPRYNFTKCTRKRSVPCSLLLIREPKHPSPIVQSSVNQKTIVENKKIY
ncbi:hypothetical protein R6Q59_012729 [Mikania micrantha]